MQLSVKKGVRRPACSPAHPPRKLAELREGEQAIIERLELPEQLATRLMEMGFLPGNTVTAARCAPGGDPRVFRVDGSEIALRSETASHLILRA